MIRERRIPTILGILLLLVSLGSGVFLIQQRVNLFPQASPENTPQEVKVTNLTGASFSVSWMTGAATSGFLRFGETENTNQVANDDRDQLTGQVGNFVTHHVTLKNLKPQTTYYFKINAQNTAFDNAGQPYKVTTAGRSTESTPSSDIASGAVFLPGKKPAEGTIIYLTISNMTPQSALVGASGSWFIPLSAAFSTDLTGFAAYDRKTQAVNIFAQGGKNGKSTILTTTANDNPLPEVILGQTYDFRQKQTLSPTPTLSPDKPATPSSGFQTEATPTSEAKLTILNPNKEGEKLNTTKPEFTGSGPAGKTIQILVESSLPYTGVAVVNQNGRWNWTPPADLTPGEHTLTLTYLGKTLTRKFTVLAAGESPAPAFTATPSATPTIKPTPTATASARTAMPSTRSGIPQPGSLLPTFLFCILGVLSLIGGLILRPFTAHER